MTLNVREMVKDMKRYKFPVIKKKKKVGNGEGMGRVVNDQKGIQRGF